MRVVILALVVLAFAVLEVFVGGARLLYSIPGVSLIAIAALLTAVPGLKASPRTHVAALVSSFFFAAYILVRNRLSEVDYIGRPQFFIMAGCLITYLLFSLFLTRSTERKWLLYALMILALVQVGIGVVQFTEVNQWMPLPWAQRRDDWWRASGLFISPNHFAGYLEIIALMSLSLVVWSRISIVGRLLIGYISLCCIAGIAISGSRGGYLSFTFGACIFMLLTLFAWRRLRPRKFAAIASISAVAGTLLFAGIVYMMFQSNTVRDRFLQINDPENMRLQLWSSALQQYELSPIVGTGAFSFLYYGRLFRDPAVQNDPVYVHNDYLQLLADYGIIGVLLFAALLGIHLVAGSKSFLHLVRRSESADDPQSNNLALCIGSLSVIAAYMVHSAVDFNMQLPVNALLISVAFAILANSKAELSGGGREKLPRTVLLSRWLLPALGLAVMIYGLPLVAGEYFTERARIALVRLQKPAEALEFAREGLKTEGKNPDLYFYYGESALQMASKRIGDPAVLRREAILSFAKGLELFPNDSRLAVKLGQAHSEAGDYFEAADALSTAEELDPNSSLVYFYRGAIEYAGGYFDDAENAFNEAIALGGEGGRLAANGLAQVNKDRANKKGQETPLTPEMEKEAKALADKFAEQAAQTGAELPADKKKDAFDPGKIKTLDELPKPPTRP